MTLYLEPIPSKRIRLALKHLLEFEHIEGCAIDMNFFHYEEAGICFACLGGISAIMSFEPSLRPKYSDWSDIDLDTETRSKLKQYELSIDYFRSGDCCSALRSMGLDPKDGVNLGREIADFHDNRDEFFRDMKKLTDDLEKVGY